MKNSRWDISREKHFCKSIKKIDKNIYKNFREILQTIASSDNPRSFGEFVPTNRHGKCHVARINDSYRLVYRVFQKERIIQLVLIGDHKEVFGKDKHS